MTKDEALRIALEALEYAGPSWIDARQPAITAIKEALAKRTWVGLDEDEFVYFCAYVNHEKLSEIENVLRDKNESKN